MSDGKSLQDIMSGDLFASSKGETVEVLRFMENHAVPFSTAQLAGLAFLDYLDRRRGEKKYSPIIKMVQKHQKDMAGPDVFIQVIEKLTLADRIKGSVRMNRIFGGDQGGR